LGVLRVRGSVRHGRVISGVLRENDAERQNAAIRKTVNPRVRPEVGNVFPDVRFQLFDIGEGTWYQANFGRTDDSGHRTRPLFVPNAPNESFPRQMRKLIFGEIHKTLIVCVF